MNLRNLVELGKEADQLLTTVKVVLEENTVLKEQQESRCKDIITMRAASTQSLFKLMAVLGVPGVLDLLRANKEFVAVHSKIVEDSNG